MAIIINLDERRSASKGLLKKPAEENSRVNYIIDEEELPETGDLGWMGMVSPQAQYGSDPDSD